MRELARWPGGVRRSEGGVHGEALPAARGKRNVCLKGVAVLTLSIAGCAGDHDHLDRLDRVSLRAGDAQARNIRVHAVYPVPPEHAPLPATYDGQRALAVMDLYYDTTGADVGTDAASAGAATGGPGGEAGGGEAGL